MTPETALYIAKSKAVLVEADRSFEIELYNAAGRAAYLAGFHAAQALISERTGRSVKTHNGVRTTFERLTADDPALPDDLRRFLARTYNLKAIADYEVGPGAEISKEKASEAVAAAHRFVAHFQRVLEGAPA